MKITKKLIQIFCLLVSGVLLYSCASTASLDDNSRKSSKTESSSGEQASAAVKGGSKKIQLPPPPVRAKEAPRFDFSSEVLKIEVEDMYYDGFTLVGDNAASKSYALKLLNDSSWAIAEVNFPAGSYEGVVNVLAPDSNHTRFTVYINNDSYQVFGSEPPIGKYELTTRSLVSFTLDQPTTVTVKIQQNDLNNPANNGHNGMTLDFITFKKIK